ncbi:MAG: hypothetical protein LBR29_09525 [Methylobacteriaceae bacterium]|jgi:DNA-binding beta-propeller fold protein YncE|nr:hypothetical protein [Methylobacteriaceae bacterium]
MKTISGNPRRDLTASNVYSCGDYAYKLDPYYDKLPAELRKAAYPAGICDKDDNIYLVSRNPNQIVVLDSSGNFVRTIGQGLFVSLHDIKVTAENTLICMDVLQHVAREIDMDGNLIRDFGTLNTPSDSGFDPNIWDRLRAEGLYVTYDSYYNADLDFLERVRSIKRSAPPFNRPTGVALNSKNEIYFSDGYGNASIHKFTRDGKLLKTWGEPGRGPGKFTVAHAIWIDPLDRVWVCDREGNAVHVFSGDGGILAYASGGFLQPSGIWGDASHVYIGERGGGLSIFDLDITLVAQIGFAFSSLRFHGLCGDSAGNLFVIPLNSFPGHRLMKLTRV